MMEAFRLLISGFLGYLIAFNLGVTAQTSFRHYPVDNGFTKGMDIWVKDIDSDGHKDLLAVGTLNGGEVSWYRNDGEMVFQKNVIRQNFDGVRSVRAGDLNNDGFIDIVAAGVQSNSIFWWENNGNENWTEHVVDASFAGAHTLDIKDLNQDGKPDLLCSGFDYIGHQGEIAWWEGDNTGNFIKHFISDRFQQSPFIFGEDLDGDEDVDVLACGELEDEVCWWENDGVENFSVHVVDNAFDAAHTVLARDIDQDGDMDILGAACMSGLLAWWENSGSGQFEKHLLGAFPGALWLDAADVDNDGDNDLVSAGMTAPKLAVWYNLGGGQFEMHLLQDQFTSAFCVIPEDLDGDSDIDLAAIGYNSNKISWFMNQLVNPDWIDGPESVAFDHTQNRYLISSCLSDIIVSIDKETGMQSMFLEDIESPLGNCIEGEVLYVSTGNSVKGFTLADKVEVFSVQIPCLQHLDGITSDHNGFLYVIDTGGRIHKIEIATGNTEMIVSSGLTQWVQDCIYDGFNNRLLSVGYAANAPIQAIDLETYEVSVATATTFGYFDGITMDQFGNVFVASHAGGGKIVKYEADFSTFEVISSGHAEPAGLDYNPYDNVLAVPNFAGDDVDFIQITITYDDGYIDREIPVNIFPNPNNGYFFINIGRTANTPSFLQLFNPSGQLILHEMISGNVRLFEINALKQPDICPGKYFLRLQKGKEWHAEKVIILK